MTITQSVSIVTPDGVYAGVTVPAATDGIVVDAPGIAVDLHGLAINGLAGRYGIWFKDGASVEVDDVKVIGMEVGLYAQAVGAATIVQRSLFTRNASLGIWLQNSYNIIRNTVVQRNGSGGLNHGGIRFDGYGELNVVRSESSQNYGSGIVADDGTKVTTMKVAIEDSQFFGNVGHGIHVHSNDSSYPVSVEVQRSASASNGGDGLQVETYGPGTFIQGGAAATASNSTISDNKGNGVRILGGGGTAVLAGNSIRNNGIWGIDTGTIFSALISKGDNVVFPDSVAGPAIQPAPLH